MSSSLFKELKRRNVYKVGVAYLVLAWVVIQVTSIAVPALHLPEWINTAVFLFGAIGFPFALFFAWEFELTPDGVKRESEIAPEDSVTAHTGRKLDFFIIGLLVIALGYFIYESRYASQLPTTVVADSISISTPLQKISNEPDGASIAVLPFVNMSSDKEQEYFSDGISEEILNVLAKIPKLHVTSRSSAFFYKDTKVNLSEVAAKLGVKNILEGSVRKSGNRIRITAQLIEAGSDKHLWSETYDRELTDVFAIQDEISAAIVVALKSKLGLNVKLAPRDMSKINLEAHNEYLQGRFYIESRNDTDIEKALLHFNKAIELAPDYAPAWMSKGWAILFLSESNYGKVPIELSIERAKPAIEKALLLDPNLPEAHAIFGLIESENNNAVKTIMHYEKAIELNPNYADVMIWYGMFLIEQPKKRFALYQKAVKLSPMSIIANNNYAIDLLFYGRNDEARNVYDHMLTFNPSSHLPYGLLGKILLAEGKYAESIIAHDAQLKIFPEYIGARFSAAYTLSTIGLTNKAASYINGTIADPVKHRFTGKSELYLSQTRATFPRSENDSLGNWVRARAESFTENYIDAARYYNLVNDIVIENDEIYSNQQIGKTEKAQLLLEKASLQLKPWVNVNAKYMYSSSINLQQAMKKNYILNFEYRLHPIYKKLRSHSEWPAILEESDKRATIQRELYQKLVVDRDVAAL